MFDILTAIKSLRESLQAADWEAQYQRPFGEAPDEPLPSSVTLGWWLKPPKFPYIENGDAITISWGLCNN